MWLTPEGRALRDRAAKVPEALACKLNMEPAELARMRDDLQRIYGVLRAVVDENGNKEGKDRT